MLLQLLSFLGSPFALVHGRAFSLLPPDQGYIHIRTDGQSMVVPVELHVSRGDVDPSPSEVDFGVLTSSLERRQASVSLFNG